MNEYLTDEEKINKILGATITEVSVNSDDKVLICTENGNILFFHSQDCCESVYLTSFEPDLKELVTDSIKEVIFHLEHDEDGYTSETTTYITILTNSNKTFKMVWVGSSNGYYSEDVNISYSQSGMPEESRW